MRLRSKSDGASSLTARSVEARERSGAASNSDLEAALGYNPRELLNQPVHGKQRSLRAEEIADLSLLPRFAAFIIDTRNMDPELQGGMIGVAGSVNPSAAEKRQCLETVSGWAVAGWAIAANPHTMIGWLAALTAEAACVPFVSFDRLIQRSEGPAISPMLRALRSPVRGMR